MESGSGWTDGGGEEIGFIEITGEKCGLSDIFRTFV